MKNRKRDREGRKNVSIIMKLPQRFLVVHRLLAVILICGQL